MPDMQELVFDLVVDSEAKVEGNQVILKMPLQRLLDLAMAGGMTVDELASYLDLEIETTEGGDDHEGPDAT